MKGEEGGVFGGKVIFHRGKGVVVEFESDPKLERFGRIILLYEVERKRYRVSAVILEKLSFILYYIVPISDPQVLDQREFIRAWVSLRCGICKVDESEDGGREDLMSRKIEISAGGFKLIDKTGDIQVGDKIRLKIAVSDENIEDKLDLKAEVLRVDKRENREEICAKFICLSTSDREKLAELIYEKILNEIGII